ncbi:spoIIIJ-associated protein [Clostridium collagenovorans DSM 3089]|uniref:RNA-binding protein KhpB n=1 Tax=Clostridium collagenovorans DSM 3089 TaxID=1121306 RepID=A0A1M5YGV1_9CLOT|nr:RNA-binding cell elongation regulator Jag/EloR [Clostridium collagenovorans]SHI11129.1 spoIIIJ-associated protein [Clostridium collagenovorans DSM 3089]
MRSIEMSGKTVDEAIEKALLELKTTRDEVEVEILEKGSKGLLFGIGSKPAQVKLTVVKNYCKEAREFLGSMLKSMNIDADIDIKEKNKNIIINLSGEDMGILIGYRGETLDSIQYLISLVINKDSNEEYRRVILDTENYRAKREETLIRLANKVAKKVKTQGKTVKLEPMNPYERRIIHSALQDNNTVKTYSEGEEPYRKVVVELKKRA